MMAVYGICRWRTALPNVIFIVAKASKCPTVPTLLSVNIIEARKISLKRLPRHQSWNFQPYTPYMGPDSLRRSIRQPPRGRSQDRTPVEHRRNGRETSDKTKYHRKTSSWGFTKGTLLQRMTAVQWVRGSSWSRNTQNLNNITWCLLKKPQSLCAPRKKQKQISPSTQQQLELKALDHKPRLPWLLKSSLTYHRQKLHSLLRLRTRYESALEYMSQRCTTGHG